MDAVELKVVLLGNPGVGKTALVCRYLYDNFGDTTSTIGASFAMKRIEAGGAPLNVGIWDTAGQERFDSLSSFYCRGARAALVVFDMTDRASFDACRSKWMKKVQSEAEPGCRICIVGTKADLVGGNEEGGGSARAVSEEEAQSLARKHDADLFYTSAKVGEGISEPFERTVQRYNEERTQATSDTQRVTIGVSRDANGRQRGTCC